MGQVILIQGHLNIIFTVPSKQTLLGRNQGSLTLSRLGGLKLCIDWGEGVPRPPLRKEPIVNRWYSVEMHVHSPIFQGQLIEKKLGR